jgi:hypothetical protein
MRVLGPDLSFFSMAPALSASGPSGLWAYGPAPGMELIPYFLGLLAWVGLAFFTVILWPLTALLRRFRGAKQPPPAEELSDKTGPRP